MMQLWRGTNVALQTILKACLSLTWLQRLELHNRWMAIRLLPVGGFEEHAIDFEEIAPSRALRLTARMADITPRTTTHLRTPAGLYGLQWMSVTTCWINASHRLWCGL